jgi:hypothetical protein
MRGQSLVLLPLCCGLSHPVVQFRKVHGAPPGEPATDAVGALAHRIADGGGRPVGATGRHYLVAVEPMS